jgi:probable phosphoglycerate mutase
VGTRFLLVRHAAIDGLGVRIAGRIAGVGLNGQGRAQALSLGRRLAGVPVRAIYTSPRERTQETGIRCSRSISSENTP